MNKEPSVECEHESFIDGDGYCADCGMSEQEIDEIIKGKIDRGEVK